MSLLKLFAEWLLTMLILAGAGRLYHIAIEPALVVILATAYVIVRHCGRDWCFGLYVELRALWWALQLRLDMAYWLMRRTFVRLRRRPAGPQVLFSVPTGEFRALLVRCPLCGMLQPAWVRRTATGFAHQCENCGEVASSL